MSVASGHQFLCSAPLKICTLPMSQNFETLEVVRELFQMQKRSYQAAIKLLITDVRSEMKDIKKEIEEFKGSLEFTQREVNDNQDRVMDMETRLEGPRVRST